MSRSHDLSRTGSRRSGGGPPTGRPGPGVTVRDVFLAVRALDEPTDYTRWAAKLDGNGEALPLPLFDRPHFEQFQAEAPDAFEDAAEGSLIDLSVRRVVWPTCTMTSNPQKRDDGRDRLTIEGDLICPPGHQLRSGSEPSRLHPPQLSGRCDSRRHLHRVN